jgi:hypothetical protein
MPTANGRTSATRAILGDAKQRGKGGVALQAVGQALNCLTLMAKLTGPPF